jgi:hypothetical protein
MLEEPGWGRVINALYGTGEGAAPFSDDLLVNQGAGHACDHQPLQ